MKKRILALLIVTVCVLTLSACGCKHEWLEATCVTPKTCSLCAQTEGEALGHDWAPATCAVPKTCSACSATEGQTLPHSEAVRDCAIDYKTLTMERQTYCTNCDQILSSEAILLDTLHDGTHFLFDSKGFLERYTNVAENFRFLFCEFRVVSEGTTNDVLTLEYDMSHLGQMDLIGGENHRACVQFTFYSDDDSDGEDAPRRCTRIAVDLLEDVQMGDLDPASKYDEELRLTDQFLNIIIIRNVVVTMLSCDPILEKEVNASYTAYYEEKDGKTDYLNLLGFGELTDLYGSIMRSDETNSLVHNNIRYYINEALDLVIEVAS